jgi:TolB-like protein/Tfp pilus assembly protein PilF
MSSIIENYTYDIFISYRQKDNKYDGWVTEFVDHLRRELEATFKEEIDVYFDINPHNGLLETHNVDASLKEKLRCLVFIPIISQTYCDSRSFAWQHEFCAFNKVASEDQFGRDIRLASGNVTSRILPVRIHEIEPDDRALLEQELGGVLRSIDFIYKSAGVNRPLRANEDHPQDNLNRTYYRDQINKVANTVKEIINALKRHNLNEEEVTGKAKTVKSKPFSNPKRTIISSSLLIALLLILGYFFLPKILNSTVPGDKSIAVLPFENLSSDKEKASFCDAIADIITNQLSENHGLRVVGRTSTLKYREQNKIIREIGAELGVNYIIEGTFQSLDNKIRINAQLIRVSPEGHIWGDVYDREDKDIFDVQSDISEQIAEKLEAVLTPREKERATEKPTANPDAYINLISADALSNNSWYYLLTGNKFVDSTSFDSAIKMYDKAIGYDPGFALAYAKRAIARTWGYYSGYLDNVQIEKCKQDIDKALELNKNLNEARIASGFYYYYCINDYQKALEYFKRASENEPGNSQCLYYMALVYRRTGDWEKSQELMRMVVRSNPQDALVLTNIGMSYTFLHNYDSAVYYQEKATRIIPNWPAPYINNVEAIISKTGSTAEARKMIDSAIIKTGKNFLGSKITLDIYDGKFGEALKKVESAAKSDFSSPGEKYLYLASIFGYLNNQLNAHKYFDSARVYFSNLLTSDPKNVFLQSSLGIAYAGLADKNRAIEAGKKAIELSGNNKLNGADRMIDLASIYVMLGDFDNSMKNIEYLLYNPSRLSTNLLKLDPVWKPLFSRPDFQELIRRYTRN